MRARLVTKGGCIRSDSSMTADKYASVAVLRKVMPSSVVNADRISRTSRPMMCGLVHK